MPTILVVDDEPLIRWTFNERGHWLTPKLLPVPSSHGMNYTLELPEKGVNLETLERELLAQALRRTTGARPKSPPCSD